MFKLVHIRESRGRHGMCGKSFKYNHSVGLSQLTTIVTMVVQSLAPACVYIDIIEEVF